MGSALLLLTALLLGQVSGPPTPEQAAAADPAADEPAVIGIGCFPLPGPGPAPLRALAADQLEAALVERLERLVADQGETGLWGGDPSDPQPTAWALLALQAAGHGPRQGRYASAVKAAVRTFIRRQRAEGHGGVAAVDAGPAERALTTQAVLRAFHGTGDHALQKASGLAYGDLLESVVAAPASEADGWAWATLALGRAEEIAPHWPDDAEPSRRWDDAAVDALLLERLATWEQRWTAATIPGQPWDAARLAEHLPWLLTAQLASLVQSLNGLDGRFLEAHPELARTDFSGADAQTLCWLAWVASECGPDRFPGWHERLRAGLLPRLEALVREGDTREMALATMAWASLLRP